MRSALLAVFAFFLACGARSSLLPVERDETEPPPSTEDPRCYSICKCLSGSTLFTAPPPNADGGCFNACDDACATQGGVEDSLSSLEGLGNIPYCEELCLRVDAMGCQADCRDIIGGACGDVDPDDCPLAVELSFKCLATQSEIFCNGDGIRIEFCSTDELALCTGE
jgi:hypothetical protein